MRPVWVAMLTYRRPEGLAEAVSMLRAQLDQVPGARLLVVDNDEQPSAASAVAAAAAGDVRVVYVHEPAPGIAAARNRALAEAGPEALVVFIDDDEQPSAEWLSTLVACWRSTGAAAVVGPVVSRFVGEPDPWITAGGFFQRLRHPTGTVVTTAATNNLLLDMAQVGPLRFDLRFGLAGGSDTVFTRTLSAAGGRIVWCDEAPVHDLVPVDRSTVAWVRARAARIGNSDSRAHVHLAPSGRRLAARLRASVRGLVRVLGGSARLVVGRLAGSPTHHARGTRTLLRGAGMLRGAWGSYVDEYAR
ncbi:GT2 family glycosyltransferase [Nocardioides albertanoniae]|uniref:GT2 family glycosyltransferase n=1 Tax=Nocardioides albertanoniae TaxID=1175486 RepID=A0A543ABH0_9ACTN|nr:glycosyltransferase family A protein [Nocardioides albertanoniae]TQL69952.1 GT2 family glycosyltransferase [Nocardioides albertanoniae]